MKTYFFAGLWINLCLVVSAAAGPRDAEWEKVNQAIADGLPKTAIEVLEPIVRDAVEDQSFAEAVKAVARKVVLESQIQGHKPEERIRRMQAALKTAPAQMKPALEAILAHWYWDFFKENRWRFMQRTEVTGSSGPDMETWDLARILAEIDTHFTAALADEGGLQQTPIAAYDELLEKGDVPDFYRPTLFDFLAYQALEFYQAGEQGAVRSEDAFELDPAEVPIFQDARIFVAWQPPAAAPPSPILKAVRLYQKLLSFHERDRDRSAYLDANLARLVFGKNVAVGDEVRTHYKTALELFIDSAAGHEISARAWAALGVELYDEGEFVQAHTLARRGYGAFPETAGGRMCFNLVERIEAKTADLNTERIWCAPWPTLDVTYRNVESVYFRAVRVPFNDIISRRHWAYGGLEHEERVRLLAMVPTLEWRAELPPTRDYKPRTEKLSAPKSLEPGFYFIFASHNRAFDVKDNQLSFSQVWISGLALIITPSHRQGVDTRGFVLNSESGEPVRGATVRAYQPGRDGKLDATARAETNADGEFRVSLREGQFVLLAEHGRDSISSTPAYHSRSQSEAVDTHRTVFFTDRSLYRPGQSIHYKGICIRGDKDAGKYAAVGRRNLEVVFQDPNGKEISRAAHTTNDYGSFHGVFTAPRDRLMGQMALRVVDGPAGDVGIRVEEYKRPKFVVHIDAPAEAPKLGARVEISGMAAAYTGAAIGGAKVRWRVMRSVQLPYWCWWWPPVPVKAIAHGAGLTADDGSFRVQFMAAADGAVPVKNEPVFDFTVHADVTDTNGETRSMERTVRVGYASLRAIVSTDEWQIASEPVKLTVEITSLDGEPQLASGKVAIFSLKQPERILRGSLQPEHQRWRPGGSEPAIDASNPEAWEHGAQVAAVRFETTKTGTAHVSFQLKRGIYRALVELKDRFGNPVTARRIVQVLDPEDPHYRVKLAHHIASPNWTVQPGDSFKALWATGYDRGRAFVEIESDGKPLKRFWTPVGQTQTLIDFPITEAMRGGLTLRTTYVRENRAYLETRPVQVPWLNKDLTLKWETFRSKLTPGRQEVWSAVITGPDGQRAAAEIVASLYDASLDQYLPHYWPQSFGVFKHEYAWSSSAFQNMRLEFQTVDRDWEPTEQPVLWRYRAFPADIIASSVGRTVLGQGGAIALSAFVVSADRAGSARAMASAPAEGISAAPKEVATHAESPVSTRSTPDLSQVTARRNLNETAFFFPQLTAGEDGMVKITFTVPEALTEWKFLGFAHDRQLRSAFWTDKAVTSKDLMVEPNPPRFVREGDMLEFVVKVTNQTDLTQNGSVRLTFADAATQQPLDAAVQNTSTDQAFEVPARQSRTYTWRIHVPDGTGFLTYKAVAASATGSDGEEGFLPVLSRKILVTESLPLSIRGQGSRQFGFSKLLESHRSTTLNHQSLTVQMVSQPAWYAVMALPYLMEFPYECSEQVFNRYYANVVARHIANSDPKIRRVFDTWKATPALDSPLTKSEDLKSVLLEETPWLRQAVSEGQARRNVGLLFDANRLEAEAARIADELSQTQLADGLWPWFPKGRPSEYITLYIVTGYGRIRQLGVAGNVQPALRAIGALDRWMHVRHRRVLEEPNPDAYVPSAIEALYLYGRSFFLEDSPLAPEYRKAADYFLAQARKHWLAVGQRQSQAHLAIALQRFGDGETAQRIVRSLREQSVVDEELGMYWRDQERSWWWYHAPIETQALMIEVFDEVAKDAKSVEACKVWLLKQKQTQSWTTTKATADAVYALLLRGDKLLTSDAVVEVQLAGEPIRPGRVETGTGFYEQSFVREEVRPEMGNISVKKTDAGVSWGGVFWQYLEDTGKITPHVGSPLSLRKTLFIKENTNAGPALRPLDRGIAVGDELVVRIELRTDRDMEYVHLKDQRASGSEPANVLSRYKYQDGLGYFESTRDTATHYFFDYLPKGVYVFEYSLHIQHQGRYQAGIAEVQCMYAPEFNSHSGSVELVVGGNLNNE